MRNRGRAGLVPAVLGGLALVVVGPTAAFACSCVSYTSVETPLRWADAVALGRVAEVRTDGRTATYVVDGEQVFEGEVPVTFEVRSPVSGAACGLEGVREGRRYVFFLTGSDAGPYKANLCGGTDRATPGYVEEVAAVTGPGTAVVASEPGEEPLPGPPAEGSGDAVLPWLGGTALLALLGGSLVWLGRARRRGGLG